VIVEILFGQFTMFRHMTLIYVVSIAEQVRGRRGHDHMVVGLIATNAISAYHH
jgi:hypothetical protein